MSGREISPGTVITLTDGRQGTVRFIGTTSFAVGDWIGVELTDATGKNDGAVQGERYFECEPGFGMFIRPTAIGSVVQQPPRESKQTARTGSNAPASRQSISAGSKRPTGLPPTAVKRQSTNAIGTPTPAPKMAPRASLRSLIDERGSANLDCGTNPTQANGHDQNLDGPIFHSICSFSNSAPLSGRHDNKNVEAWVPKHPKASDTGDTGTSSPLEEPSNDETPDTEGEGAQDGEAAPALAPRTSRQSLASSRTAANRPGPGATTAQRQNQSAALSRELEELQAKLRVMEKKRVEDREKLKMLEQLQSDRDKFEAIIQKLQAKYQPQQMEITELRKKLKDTEARHEEVERIQAEHESLMEMATLDREMAERDSRSLEVEVLREENEEFGQITSPEERSSHGWLQMEKSNERLRDALMRLRDMTQQQEGDLRDQIKELEQDLEEYSAVKSEYEATKEKLLVAETNVDELKQQLETALGAEEMIEELADKNMRYQEEINELKAAIEDLESLREISDELEYTHIETEKQLQEEIDYRDGVFSDQVRKIAQQDEVIEDLEYTLSRFRELVTNLQSDLEDMRASQQISETEASDLTTRSRAMMDLNMKLQASVSKAQTKSINVELNRMEAEEAAHHLSIVKLYLPEYFDGERNAVLALLRFKRVSFKAGVMNNTIRERVAEQSAISTYDEAFNAHEVLEHLLWISTVCDRFVNYISACSPEQFANTKGALFEMEPVERTLNLWLESLKKNEVNMKKFAAELQRSIALLAHLAETLLPP
ncbi:hypothetical protein N7526_007782 [Penicillium atrosanguineum]|nr:hypothetical protein N7526_007782 [Penicillium atrosanguineum]